MDEEENEQNEDNEPNNISSIAKNLDEGAFHGGAENEAQPNQEESQTLQQPEQAPKAQTGTKLSALRGKSGIAKEVAGKAIKHTPIGKLATLKDKAKSSITQTQTNQEEENTQQTGSSKFGAVGTKNFAAETAKNFAKGPLGCLKTAKGCFAPAVVCFSVLSGAVVTGILKLFGCF